MSGPECIPCVDNEVTVYTTDPDVSAKANACMYASYDGRADHADRSNLHGPRQELCNIGRALGGQVQQGIPMPSSTSSAESRCMLFSFF